MSYIFVTITILAICLGYSAWYISRRFDKTPKEDRLFDNMVYILCPLLTTCIGVLFALWIDLHEVEIRQKEATVKTLRLCMIDAENALQLIKRHDSLISQLPAAEYLEVVRGTINSFGMPYPKVIEQLLLSENSLSNCSANYIQIILRELNKLDQLRSIMNEVQDNLEFAHYMNSCHIALEEILGLTRNEISHIEGKITQQEHDHEIDVVFDGKFREQKLAEGRAYYEKALKQ